MSKRFIDTEIFNDPKFMEYSKDSKLFWIYAITKCNHAGILTFNEKLIKFQTGIDNFERVFKELGNSLIRVNKELLFIPKFLKFQYPNFPKSKVMQQEGAIKILNELNIDFNSYLTVNEELTNSYVNVSVNVSGNDIVIEKEAKEQFELFFNEYHKITELSKTEKDSSFKYFKKLKLEERRKAYLMIQKYYDSVQDKKYIKKCRTYLSDKNYEDEY